MEEIKTIRLGDLKGLEILLKEGQAYMKPSGNSMKPIINSKDKILLQVVDSDIEVGDAVYCKVNGKYYVHLVKAIKKQGDKYQYQIGNNRGGINGWTSEDNVFATIVTVNDVYL